MSKTKVTVDGRTVEVEQEHAEFARALMEYGIALLGIVPDEQTPEHVSLIIANQEDVLAFADVFLTEFKIPTAKDDKVPSVGGTVLVEMHDEMPRLVYFMDIAVPLMGPVGGMFALLASRRKEAAKEALWDGHLVPPVRGTPQIVVGSRVLVSMHCRSPHFTEHVWVRVSRADSLGSALQGKVDEDAKFLTNVKKGEPVSFFRHEVFEVEDGPRQACGDDLN